MSFFNHPSEYPIASPIQPTQRSFRDVLLAKLSPTLFGDRHKNIKLIYYGLNLFRQLIPGFFFRRQLKKKLLKVSTYNLTYIRQRLNYYNKMESVQPLAEDAIMLSQLKLGKKLKVYFFDTFEFTRYFNPSLKAHFLFGDIEYSATVPSIVKSRPVHGENSNSVILKLEKLRHFTFVKDTRSFANKKNMLIGRGVISRTHRVRFFEMYFNHPLCDLGKINKTNENDHWLKPRITFDQHLDFKFILALEGNDVASNLKWIMSSNSLAVMPKPKFETWFMEGTLIPDYHYVLIKDDYSDLEERLNYFIQNPTEGVTISKNANEYVNQFRHREREDLISLLVLEKYFVKTGQIWE